MTKYTNIIGVQGEPPMQHTIQNATGTPFPARANLRFQGNVRVIDGGDNDATIVEVGSQNIDELQAQIAALTGRIEALERS